LLSFIAASRAVPHADRRGAVQPGAGRRYPMMIVEDAVHASLADAARRRHPLVARLVAPTDSLHSCPVTPAFSHTGALPALLETGLWLETTASDSDETITPFNSYEQLYSTYSWEFTYEQYSGKNNKHK